MSIIDYFLKVVITEKTAATIAALRTYKINPGKEGSAGLLSIDFKTPNNITMKKTLKKSFSKTSQMVGYHKNILCIQANWLFGEGDIMTKDIYEHLVKRKQINVVSRGCRNTPALVEFDSLPARFKTAIEEKVGNPRKSRHCNLM